MKKFSDQLVTRWSALCEEFERELRDGVSDGAPPGVFPLTTSNGFAPDMSFEQRAAHKRWQHFKSRLVEHVCITHDDDKHFTGTALL